MKLPSLISPSSSSLRDFANASFSMDPFMTFILRGAVPKFMLSPYSFSALDIFISSSFSVVLSWSVPRRDFVHGFPHMERNIRCPPGNWTTTVSTSTEIYLNGLSHFFLMVRYSRNGDPDYRSRDLNEESLALGPPDCLIANATILLAIYFWASFIA